MSHLSDLSANLSNFWQRCGVLSYMHVSIEGETTAHAVEAKITLTCKDVYFVRVEELGKDLF